MGALMLTSVRHLTPSLLESQQANGGSMDGVGDYKVAVQAPSIGQPFAVCDSQLSAVPRVSNM